MPTRREKGTHLHPIHNLWFIGGIVICDKCGSIASTDRKCKLQDAVCEPAKVGGPTRRIRALKEEGTVKGTYFKVWPDGSKAENIKVPKRIYPFRKGYKRKTPEPSSFQAEGDVSPTPEYPSAVSGTHSTLTCAPALHR